MTPEAANKLPYRPCAGVMMINADARIFAGQRRDSAAWQMPQGGIDENEAPANAALRELWEETGVVADRVELVAEIADWVYYDLPPELLGKVWKGRYRGQMQRWFLYRFLGSDDEIDIVTEHPEFSKWRWIGAEEMLEAIVPFKHAVYTEVISAFHAHLG